LTARVKKKKIEQNGRNGIIEKRIKKEKEEKEGTDRETNNMKREMKFYIRTRKDRTK
jgi:hypothetical protein